MRDEGVCVRLWDWSETSQTVSVFTREAGLVRGIAKGAKREKGSFSGGFELLTRGELCAIVKGGGRLATFTEWDLREVYPGLRKALSAYYAASYAADLVQHFFDEHDPHPELYDALAAVLSEFGSDDAAFDARVLLEFQWSLLREAGYRPDLGEGDPGAGSGATRSADGVSRVLFSAEAGGVVAADRSGKAWGVRPATLEVLRDLSRSGRAAGGVAPVRRANRLLAAYIRATLDREPPSMRFLFGSDPAGRGRGGG